MAALSMAKIKKGAAALDTAVGIAIDMCSIAADKMEPLAQIPFVGDYVTEFQDFVSMFRDYRSKKYTRVPAIAILAGAAILAYLVSPIDIIPDGIPILGFIDDAFIIGFVVDTCVGKELEIYRKWRAENEKSEAIASAE